ncbi:acyl-CoA desaturase [Planctomycetales bacterium ZRK34]|nr:acyl-CoA desaturase [Planctomycetales bacterium ZRK34]
MTTQSSTINKAGDVALSTPGSPLALPIAVNRQKFQWVYVVSLVGMHVLAGAAILPWLFTWSGLIALLVGIFFFGQGINFCYHRLLTHRSLVVPKWLERFWVLIALCCMEDTPCKWVTAHRHHHKHSDEQEDPHSPLVNFFWSHFQWLTLHNLDTQTTAAYQRYCRDILADPFYMAMEKKLWISPLIYLVHALLFFAAGFAGGYLAEGTLLEGLRVGLSLLVWGVILRTVLVWHITWSVNSVTHLFGSRLYDTEDNSRNNWLVGLFAAGEGWHNNHHYDQASASNQHRWWQFDLTWYHICVLKRLGLAKKVIAPRHIRHAQNAARRQGA